jgi:hypothetical protein
MQQVFVGSSCVYYPTRHLMDLCPAVVEAFLGVCEPGEHNLGFVVTPVVACDGDELTSFGTDGCSVEVNGCADGNSYRAECNAGSSGEGSVECSCFVGEESVRTFYSGGYPITEFCENDIALDYCDFPFLDTGR